MTQQCLDRAETIYPNKRVKSGGFKAQSES